MAKKVKNIFFIENEVCVSDTTCPSSDKEEVGKVRKIINNLPDEDFMKFFDYAVRAETEHHMNLKTNFENGFISKEDYEKYKESYRIHWS